MPFNQQNKYLHWWFIYGNLKIPPCVWTCMKNKHYFTLWNSSLCWFPYQTHPVLIWIFKGRTNVFFGRLRSKLSVGNANTSDKRSGLMKLMSQICLLHSHSDSRLHLVYKCSVNLFKLYKKSFPETFSNLLPDVADAHYSRDKEVPTL